MEIPNLKLPEMPPALQIEPHMPAKEFELRIRSQIESFLLKDVDQTKQGVEARAILPGGKELVVSFFGWHGPDMLVLYGFDEQGRDCRLLVEYSAVHILLTAVDLAAKPEASRRIGFQSTSSPEDTSATDESQS